MSCKTWSAPVSLWFSAACAVTTLTGCLVGPSTSILPATDMDTPELRSGFLSYMRIYPIQGSLQLQINCDFPHRTVGIVLLVVILAALLVLGCWYFKKRSGYKLIRVSTSRLPVVTRPTNLLPVWAAPIKVILIGPPVPVYLSPLQSPRLGSPGYTGGQYSEGEPEADNKMPLTDFGSFRPAVRDKVTSWLKLVPFGLAEGLLNHQTGGQEFKPFPFWREV